MLSLPPRVSYGLFCSMFFFFKQKTAYEMRISDWSSDVCSSDLERRAAAFAIPHAAAAPHAWQHFEGCRRCAVDADGACVDLDRSAVRGVRDGADQHAAATAEPADAAAAAGLAAGCAGRRQLGQRGQLKCYRTECARKRGRE